MQRLVWSWGRRDLLRADLGKVQKIKRGWGHLLVGGREFKVCRTAEGKIVGSFHNLDFRDYADF